MIKAIKKKLILDKGVFPTILNAGNNFALKSIYLNADRSLRDNVTPEKRGSSDIWLCVKQTHQIQEKQKNFSHEVNELLSDSYQRAACYERLGSSFELSVVCDICALLAPLCASV